MSECFVGTFRGSVVCCHRIHVDFVSGRCVKFGTQHRTDCSREEAAAAPLSLDKVSHQTIKKASKNGKRLHTHQFSLHEDKVVLSVQTLVGWRQRDSWRDGASRELKRAWTSRTVFAQL